MGKRICERGVSSLEWKIEEVIGDESEFGDCDEVTVNQEESEQWTEWGWRNEEGNWFHR